MGINIYIYSTCCPAGSAIDFNKIFAIFFTKPKRKFASPFSFVYNKTMSKIYLSAEAEECVRDTLSSQGHQIINIVPSPLVDRRIASHADLFFCDLGQLLFHGEPSRLGRLYPKDIPYNACSTGKYFIHNLKYTDPLLHSEAKKLGQIFIHVAQGYARCSCLPVDADSVITADLGIASACRRAGLHVLTIRTGHILLPGFSSGFIGGAAGRIGTQIFFSRRSSLPSGQPGDHRFHKGTGARMGQLSGISSYRYRFSPGREEFSL